MQTKSSDSVRVFYPRYDRETLAALLKGRLPRLQGKLAVRYAALFGSYATGRQTAASDVDLLVVYSGEPRDDAFAVVKRTLDVRVRDSRKSAKPQRRSLCGFALLRSQFFK